MRMILIDPFERTITEREVAPGLQAMYAALTGPGFPVADHFPTDPANWAGLEREPKPVDCIDIRGIGCDRERQLIDLIIDDEGRLKGHQACFRMGGPQGFLIAGRALIAGHDAQGETTGTQLPISDVIRTLEWLPWDVDYTPPPPVILVGEDAIAAFRRAAAGR